MPTLCIKLYLALYVSLLQSIVWEINLDVAFELAVFLLALCDVINNGKKIVSIMIWFQSFPELSLFIEKQGPSFSFAL